MVAGLESRVLMNMVKQINAGPLVDEQKETPSLHDMVSVLISPKPGEEAKVAEYKERIENLHGNHRLGRMDIVMVLAKSMEPCDAANVTELGRHFPDLIPRRTIKEAWEVVLAHSDIKSSFERRFRGRINREDVSSEVQFLMFDKALFWDSTAGPYSAYVRGTKNLARRALRDARDIGNGSPVGGLLYGEGSHEEEAGGRTVSKRRIADPATMNRLTDGLQGTSHLEGIRSFLEKKLAALTSFEENLLRMRFGVTADTTTELSRKGDWDAHPTSAFRVRLEELRIMDKLRKRGASTDVRNSAAKSRDETRARRLRQGTG